MSTNWIRQQDRFNKWLQEQGIEYRSKLGYTTFDTDDRSYTIRFADHAQPKFGGYSGNGRYGAADLSLDPMSGNGIVQAKRFVREKEKGSFVNRAR